MSCAIIDGLLTLSSEFSPGSAVFWRCAHAAFLASCATHSWARYQWKFDASYFACDILNIDILIVVVSSRFASLPFASFFYEYNTCWRGFELSVSNFKRKTVRTVELVCQRTKTANCASNCVSVSFTLKRVIIMTVFALKIRNLFSQARVSQEAVQLYSYIRYQQGVSGLVPSTCATML